MNKDAYNVIYTVITEAEISQKLIIEVAEKVYVELCKKIAERIYCPASNGYFIMDGENLENFIEEFIKTMPASERQKIDNLYENETDIFQCDVFDILWEELCTDGFAYFDTDGNRIINVNIETLNKLLSKGHSGNGSAIERAKEELESKGFAYIKEQSTKS